MSRTGFDDTGLHWVAVELISGDIICEVPVLQVNLLEYHMQESSTGRLDCPVYACAAPVAGQCVCVGWDNRQTATRSGP